MFTLIKREIEDNIAYFAAAALFSTTLVIVAVSFAYNAEALYEPALALSIPIIVLAILGFTAMGASQMYTDKTRNISAFLSTLRVTRAQILVAKIVTGILSILVLLVPLAVAAAVLLRIFRLPYPIYPHFISEIFTAVFLTAFACYCLGLQIGWSPNKVIPVLGSIGSTAVIVPLVVIKGFGACAAIIMLLLIVASLTRTWQKFTSTPLLGI
jgi:hypothetical protein